MNFGKRELLWQLLVPTVRPNGKFYRTRFHKVWDKKIQDLANGLTILTPSKGIWKSCTGEVLTERMIPVIIRANRKQILEIVKFTKSYYQQDAIFYWLISEESYIYE